MANQNVGTPRFYIDTFQFLRSQGIGKPDSDDDAYSLNPSGGVYRNFFGDGNANDGRAWLDYRFDAPTSLGAINYIAFLGHDQANAFRLDFQHPGTGTMHNISYTNVVKPYINMSDEHGGGGYDGFTIGYVDYDIPTGVFLDNSADFNIPEFLDNGEPALRVNFAIYGVGAIGTPNNASKGQPFRIGSVSAGRVFDMPHSPELSLTMSHEYDGVKKQETAGGSTLSYVNYHKPPDWGNLQAWQLEGWDWKYSGRRVWNLSFNYLSDSDIEPYNYHIDSNNGHSDWKDNWFTNVLHYTNGGQLPFIFCPDPSIFWQISTWTTPEFAICRFDMKTFKREQVANGIYNIKVKIKESW